MGRPSTHDRDSFLDTAARLFAAGGAGAVTMAAVARAAGAPSGSIYHRFPDRPALLAALWLRSSRRFLEKYLRVIDAPHEAVAATAWIVDWCRDNLAEAIVLQAGAHAFAPDEWSDTARAELAEHEASQQQALRGVVESIAASTGRPHDLITFALVDLPLAVVRPYLLRGDPPTARATELARELAEPLLTTPHPDLNAAPVIRVDDLTGPEIVALLQEHVDEMRSISSPESKHALDLDGLRVPEVTFWTMWSGGELVACGAVKDLGAGTAEIKSMRTSRAHKQRGFASALLSHILAEATALGFHRISLETGAQEFFEPARTLYAKHGFEICGPFGDYRDDPNSTFMTRELGESVRYGVFEATGESSAEHPITGRHSPGR